MTSRSETGQAGGGETPSNSAGSPAGLERTPAPLLSIGAFRRSVSPNRRPRGVGAISLAGVLMAGLVAGAGRASSPGEEVAVVYNLNQAPDSRLVAEHYAQRRGVPARHLIGLPLPRTEAITRAAFREQLQRPLVQALQDRGLARFPGPRADAAKPGLPESKVRYLVLAYGVPVKISPDPKLDETIPENLAPALRRNEAAVDTELACLPLLERGAPLTGPLTNPYYGATNVAALHPTNGLFLVTRLDGPSYNVALSLVDRALAAETNGFFGRAYFDTRGLPTNSSYFKGDQWIQEAYQAVRRQGFESVLDTAPATFPVWEPLPQIAIYAGWYDGKVSGPFTRAPVEFVPGAVAYHLHSFSASTLRSATACWAGPLLARGAAATMGCVAEPYLDLTPNVGAFFTWLISLRHNFAEAAYASQPVLSWQTTIIGDPLYRPMARDPRELHEELLRGRSPLLPWSVLRVVNLNLAVGEPAARMIEFLARQPLTGLSAVLSEKLGDLYRQERQPARAIERYQAALELAPSPNQRLQLWFKLIAVLTAGGRDADALRVYGAFFKEHPDYPGQPRFYEQALQLAKKVGDARLVEEYEREIARLTPAPAATNAPPAGASSGKP